MELVWSGIEVVLNWYGIYLIWFEIGTVFSMGGAISKRRGIGEEN